MKPWPDDPFLQGYYEPITTECTAPDLVIEGEIPRDINGTFFRNGPNPQFTPLPDYHFFGGDGMVHAFHFKEGGVSHRNRWARTPRFRIEERMGSAQFAALNPMGGNPEFLDFALSDKGGVANTSVLWHGNRLLLLEEAHLPFEMHPDTLDSLGTWDFYGKLKTTMTAHPKVDPVSGELVFYSYMTEGPFSDAVELHKVGSDGFMSESHPFNAPYASMLHDFIVTENYIVFPVMPLTTSLERLMEGAPMMAWEPDLGSRVGVMPRGGAPADIQWIDARACYAFHFMNGYDKDGVITFDACLNDHAPLFPTPDGQSTGITNPRPARWRVDMNADNPNVTIDYLSDSFAEFPVIDPRHAMREYRHCWFTSSDKTVPNTVPDSEWAYNAVEHFNVETGKKQSFGFSGNVSEPMFVPRSEDAAEGDGYVLSVVYVPETNTSDMCVFDAQYIGDGPIGRAKVTHRVPACFHGTWKPAMS
jgi:carotenoid cleavage dioxygenase